MFYKKTGVSVVVTEEVGFKKVIEDGATEQIINMMRDGMTIPQIIKLCCDENDEVIKVLAPQKAAFAGFDEQCTVLSGAAKALRIKKRNKVDAGRDVICHWFVNCTILLKLKFIENNEDNGWLFCKLIGDRAEIVC